MNSLKKIIYHQVLKINKGDFSLGFPRLGPLLFAEGRGHELATCTRRQLDVEGSS